MKCGALAEDENDDIVSVPCEEEARWYSCVPIIDIPVCDLHKCRCNKPLPGIGAMESTSGRFHL